MMRSFHSVATAAAASLLFVLAATQDVECQDGVHIIVARASGESPGFGTLKKVMNDTLDQIPNSDAVAVKYPATIISPTYTQSQPQGVGNMTDMIKEYVDACPDGKIVLMGYSQGAHVVADVLLGNVNPSFDQRPAIDSKYTQNLVAAILMGDPTFVVDQPVNVGNSTKDGVFPRQNPDWQQDGFADKTQSYCDEGDFYCASGEGDNATAIHIGYVPEYGDRAVEFVVSKYHDFVGGSPPSGTPSPTGTAVSSTAPSGTASPSQSETPSASSAAPVSPPSYTGGADQFKAGSILVTALGAGVAMFL